MITKEECDTIRSLLEQAWRPMFLFDDDPDGLCSFCLLYRYANKGKGVVVKNSPVVTEEIYAKKVESYGPDLLVILDKPKVEQEFLSSISIPVIWIDHHEPQNPAESHVHYFNPLNHTDVSTPTTYQCWRVVSGKGLQSESNDVWFAAVGCIGDWFFPEIIAEQFKDQFPGLLPEDITTAPSALFRKDSKVGMLSKVLYFLLKGRLKECEKHFKILTRVNDPREILEQSSAQGKYLFKWYKKINEEYERLLEMALSMIDDSPFLTAIIPQNKFSFSSELSNEVFYHHPEKVIILGRSSSGYTKGSIRTSFSISLPDAVSHALMGVDGYGGGHPQACGFRVNDADFDLFLTRLKENITAQITALAS